jgi:hypothetical protein
MDETHPVEMDDDGLPAPKSPAPTLSPELMAAGRADKAAWKSGKGPGRWTTIGCGLGIAVLIAALFAGSSLMRRTVWAGFAGTTQRLVRNLPGDLPPGDRMKLTRNLDAFAAQLKELDDPYPLMGQFRNLARRVLEDRRITREEAEELNLFLDEQLAGSKLGAPYSLP